MQFRDSKSRFKQFPKYLRILFRKRSKILVYSETWSKQKVEYSKIIIVVVDLPSEQIFHRKYPLDASDNKERK